MLKEGYFIHSTIPYGIITNAERQRRQILRTRCFLEELGVENIVIGTDRTEFHVSGFVPKDQNSIDSVNNLFHQLGAIHISHLPGSIRRKQ